MIKLKNLITKSWCSLDKRLEIRVSEVTKKEINDLVKGESWYCSADFIRDCIALGLKFEKGEIEVKVLKK